MAAALKNPDLLVRSYRAQDDAACQLLERRANQFGPSARGKPSAFKRLLQSLVDVHPSHPRGYDGKARLYEDYEIVVCEDTAAARVVAAVVVTLKQVSLGGQPRTAGWLFDLRVDEDYQRQGIGRALSAELEARLARRGVSLLYLSVNRDNEKAKGLYTALGFSHASVRAPPVKILAAAPPPPPADVAVVRMEPAVAAALVSRYYPPSRDFSPSEAELRGLLRRCESDGLGTFVAVRRAAAVEALGKPVWEPAELAAAVAAGKIKDYGGVSLWNGSAASGFQVNRLLLPNRVWVSPLFQCSVLALLVAACWGWGGRLYGKASGGALHEQGSVTAGLTLLEGAAFAGLSFAAYKAASLFHFVITRDPRRLRARAFAPISAGAGGAVLLHTAVGESQRVARMEGFGMWIINLDEDHPLKASLPTPGFRTTFLQKRLDQPSGVPPPAFDAAAFCDPRDF